MPRAKGKNFAIFNRSFLLLVLPWVLKKLGDTLLFFIKFLVQKAKGLYLFIAEAFKVVYLSYIRKSYTPPPAEIKPKKRRYRRHHKRILRWLLPTPLKVGIAFGIAVFLFFIYSLFIINLAHNLPSPSILKEDNSPMTTEIYDRNGKLLYRLYEDRNRTPIQLSSLPSYLINATVAIEDKNYWGHPGVDLVGIARAMISDSKGEALQGGSTITQQLVKNTLLTPDRTWQRKVKEVLLAFWTEKLFTKQQILEMYLNQVPYGGPAWGIEAASETYFGKPAKDLDLAQAAYLAGLPVSPTSYSPYGPHPELGKERQREVLQRMVEDHYINQTQENQALLEDLKFNPPVENIKAPHFVMYVRDLLAQKYGDRTVSQGGLKVYTTLDLDTQNMAEQVVAEEVAKLANLNVTNGAAMIVDPRNGQILAMVGSKDYYDPKIGNFNVALALRQPGSSIKVVTYSTAFKMGLSPGTTVLDAPIAFTSPWETYAPVNYDGRFHGLVTIRTALGSSFNIPAVKVLNFEGIPNFLQTAKDMGITTFNDPQSYGLSLTLGGADVRLIDMMSVYSTLADMGVKRDVNPILKITDSKGQVIEDNTNPVGDQVLPTGVAYMITNVLSDNGARTPAFGPKSLLVIPNHTVAVKTGTTDNKRDNWTFGYTPKLAVGVWVGNNDNTPMDPALTSGVTGAAPIWNHLMTNLLQNQPDMAFNRPPDVSDGVVNGHKDLVLTQSPAFANQPASSSSPTPGIITLTNPTPSTSPAAKQ